MNHISHLSRASMLNVQLHALIKSFLSLSLTHPFFICLFYFLFNHYWIKYIFYFEFASTFRCYSDKTTWHKKNSQFTFKNYCRLDDSMVLLIFFHFKSIKINWKLIINGNKYVLNVWKIDWFTIYTRYRNAILWLFGTIFFSFENKIRLDIKYMIVTNENLV